MTRSELIERIADLHPQLQLKDAELAVKVILDALSNALSKGGRVEIRSFGSFGLNYRPPRQGRNPKTGDDLEITPRRVITFRASNQLKSVMEKQDV